VADCPVRVDLVRSGGFAGIPVHASVDSATLPVEEASELAALLDRLDMADLAERATQPPRGADRFQYDLTIQRGAVRQHVSLAESAVPPDLRPLLTWLLRHTTPP
jgi:emfourin